MSLLRTLGKKHLEIATQWIGTAATFGITAGLAGIYFTEWKAVLQYVPYYNGKYPKESE